MALEMRAGEACFEKALVLEPHAARAHFNLARSRKPPNPEGDIARLRELLKQEHLSPGHVPGPADSD